MSRPPTNESPSSLPPSLAAPLLHIEPFLAECLSGIAGPPSLRDAMAYATLDGGKRLRPLLAWHACVAAGGDGPESLPACGAVELVHCFSLAHDDLPALDDDDMRRGRPTLHRHAGEAMAILAGDALLSHAFSLLVGRAPAHLAATLVRELSDACERMIGGQVLDTLGFGEEVGQASEIERLERVHRGKTGAMLAASARMGAMCSPSSTQDDIHAIGRYGEAIGLMFQIVDDLLDVTQTAEHTGKRTGKDAAAGKLTYPGLLGVEGSRRRVAELLASAEAAIEGFGSRGASLSELARFMAERTR